MNFDPKKLITVDFETYYDKEYTLKKLSTSEYIRDERFEAHCMGIKHGNKQTRVYRGRDVQRVLEDINWSDRIFLGHHAQFDGLICEHHFGIQPALYACTMSMSRAVHGMHTTRHGLDAIAKLHGLAGKTRDAALNAVIGVRVLPEPLLVSLAEYCRDDTDDTYALFFKLYEHLTDAELQLIDITIKLFTRPVLHVDIPRVEAELKREMGGKADAVLKTGLSPIQLSSNPQFVAELEKHGVQVPVKISLTTGKIMPALAKNDLEFQKLGDHPKQAVRDLYNARLKVKSTIGESRALRFLTAGSDGKRLPIYLGYCAAHTHRWGGGDKLNAQNLPRISFDKTGNPVPGTGELRQSIQAPPGCEIVVVDSGQIEARGLAWQADEHVLMTEFATPGGDPYKRMASTAFNVPFDLVTKDQRFIGKICILGLGYGMGHVKFQITLEQGTMGPKVIIPLDEAKRLVTIYRTLHKAIPAYWRFLEDILKRMMNGMTGSWKCFEYGKGYIRMPSGLFLHYPDLRGHLVEGRNGEPVIQDMSYKGLYSRQKIYGGLLAENITQSVCRDIIAEQMLQVADAGWRIVMTTHDEIACIAPKKQASRCFDEMMKIMKTTPAWAKGLVLNAEGGHAPNYIK